MCTLFCKWAFPCGSNCHKKKGRDIRLSCQSTVAALSHNKRTALLGKSVHGVIHIDFQAVQVEYYRKYYRPYFIPSNFKVCNSEPSQSITPAFICRKATGTHFSIWTYFNCQTLHEVLSGSSILKGQIDCLLRSSVFQYSIPYPYPACCQDVSLINQSIDPDLIMRAMTVLCCVEGSWLRPAFIHGITWNLA